jgi:hypothetical protein
VLSCSFFNTVYNSWQIFMLLSTINNVMVLVAIQLVFHKYLPSD